MKIDLIGACITGFIGYSILLALIIRVMGLLQEPAYYTNLLIVVCILNLSLMCIFLFRMFTCKKRD